MALALSSLLGVLLEEQKMNRDDKEGQEPSKPRSVWEETSGVDQVAPQEGAHDGVLCQKSDSALEEEVEI